MQTTRPLARILASIAAFVGLLAASPVCADIEVEVVASPSPAQPGETLDVDITVTNDGLFDLTDVEVVLDYPPNAMPTSDAYHDGDCPSSGCESGEQATFQIATLAAGKGITFAMPIRVANSVAAGTNISFDVEVFDNAALQASGSALVTVDDTREVELGLAESRDPIAPGGTVTYAITYGVLESSAGSPGATLTMPLPAGTSFVSASDGGALSQGTIAWSLGNVGPGDGGERLVTLQVDAGVDVGSIIHATATYQDTASNATSFETTTRVQNPIPLQLTAIASPDPARASEVLEFELTVTNTGPFDRTGVSLRLAYPDKLEATDDGLHDGDCPSSACENPERVVFDIGTLPAGEGVTYSMPLQIDNATETGTVITFEADVIDNAGDQAASGASIVVVSDRELELIVADDREPVAPDGLITFALTYGVLESATGVSGAMLSLPLPDGTSFVSANGGGALSNGVVEWSLGNLNPGATGKRAVTVRVDAGLDDGAIILAEGTFEDPADRVNGVRHQATTRVQSDNPLDLDIIASPDAALPGETLDVEITITNKGQFDVTGVIARLEYPQDVTALFNSTFGGTCPSSACETRETAVFDVGTIDAGAGVTISVPMQPGFLVASGTVIPFEADVRDSQGNTRRATAAVAVDAGRDLDFALVESDEPVAPGSLLTYRLTYGTLETGAGAAGTTMSLVLPSGTSFVSASDCGLVSAGKIVTWDLGELDPGDGGERKVTVMVDGGLPDGTILSAAAFLDETGAPEQIRFEEATRVQSALPLDVDLVATPNPADPQTTLDVVVSVTNTTLTDRTDVVVWMDYPDGLLQLFDSEFDGDCPSSACEARERATFQIDVLPAGTTTSYVVPPEVFALTPAGTVINFDVLAEDGTGFSSADGDAVKVGPGFSPATNPDLDASDSVGFNDLTLLLGSWGPCDAFCPEDLDESGAVGFNDLTLLLGSWGPVTDC